MQNEKREERSPLSIRVPSRFDARADALIDPVQDDDDLGHGRVFRADIFRLAMRLGFRELETRYPTKVVVG